MHSREQSQVTYHNQFTHWLQQLGTKEQRFTTHRWRQNKRAKQRQMVEPWSWNIAEKMTAPRNIQLSQEIHARMEITVNLNSTM